MADSEGVTSEDVVTILKKTIEELEEKCRFQKEVILKAEAQLVETQDKVRIQKNLFIFDTFSAIFSPKTAIFSSKTVIFDPKS